MIFYFVPENGIDELGAQWIHGQEGNPIYEFALEHDLIAKCPNELTDDEKNGHYCTNTGHTINSKLVELTLNELDRIKEYCSTLTDLEYTSLEDIFRSKFNDFKLDLIHKLVKDEKKTTSMSKETNKIEINKQKLSSIDANTIDCFIDELDDIKFMDALLEWYFTFEKIDNACDSLSSLSVKGYTEYIDCPGFSLVNLNKGYSSVTEAIVSKIPSKCIRLNHQVNRIYYGPDNCLIESTNGNEKYTFNADYCILTVSVSKFEQIICTLFFLNII